MCKCDECTGGAIEPYYTQTHAETVRRYDVPGECSVRIADWPYDCNAKDEHPDHVVFICDEHLVWWHEPDWQPAE